MTSHRLLAALVAAHKNRKVVGRTRLQKTVRLLQAVGFPTAYEFMDHFYGPYSSGLQSDVVMLTLAPLGLSPYLTENPRKTEDGTTYWELTADPAVDIPPDIERFRHQIDLLQETETTVLELAATYAAFRDLGADHAKALEMLRLKKADKCTREREEQALNLLINLGLPTA